jgi:MFS family permease
MTVDAAPARRNATVLACAQALGGASPAIVVSLGGLVGTTLAPDPAYATLPVSIFNLGLAAGTVPAGALMRRAGRRTGYLLGCGLGMAAGLLAAIAIGRGAFALFCAATMIAGFYSSFIQSYRFAAADAAPPDERARAISRVMLGGLAAAVIGPQTVIWTRDLVDGVPYAGAFLGQAGLALLAVPVILAMRPVPLPPAGRGGGRPLAEILRQPRFLVAVAAGLVSYGLMSFVMTAAPVAMIGCGHSVGAAALGIQWHVLAMYGPSFFTGRLIERFGKVPVTMTGLALIAVAGAIGLSGITVAHFWIALVVLGLGWNFGFIGATALVTDCYRPEERARVQSLNDFLVFGSVAVASFSSGRLLDAGGWTVVNGLVFVPVAVALVLLALSAKTLRTAS